MLIKISILCVARAPFCDKRWSMPCFCDNLK